MEYYIVLFNDGSFIKDPKDNSIPNRYTNKLEAKLEAGRWPNARAFLYFPTMDH